MRHPKRAITRDVRVRQPKGRGRERAELEALTVIHAHKVGALPVVEHGRVAGILTETDLVRALKKR